MKPNFFDRFLDLKYYDMNYRLFIPSGKCNTLILHLHGSAGRGNDNIKNLNYMDQNAFHTIVNENLSFILVPQVPENHKFFDITWDQVIYNQNNIKFEGYIRLTLELLKETIQKYDIKKVYVEGYSMGGFTAFEIATRHPELFDGILAICGGVPLDKLDKIKDKKIIIVHGSDDHVVNKKGSIEAYNKLIRLKSNVRLYIINNCKHDSWNFVYNNQNFLKNFIK